MPETLEAPGRLEALIESQHKILGIYVTFRCPLECAHCGVDSHPRRTERIEPDFAVEQIERAARTGTFSAIHLNGGEPFLERSLVTRISKKSQELGLGLAITTSGHWGTSLERARSVLSELPVLSQLMISTDVYHRPFVELNRVAYTARASVDKGAVTQVAVCTRDGRRNEFVDQLCEVLGEDLLAEIDLVLFPLDPVGRGADLSEAHWRDTSEALPQGRCYQINRPVLLPDGTVSACCNTLVTNKRPGDNPLKLGNCHDRNLEELLIEGRESPYLQAIRFGGPALLAQLATEFGAGSYLQKHYREGDICHLCDEILHSRPVQEALSKAFAEPAVRQRIALLRTLALRQQPTKVRGSSNERTKGDSDDVRREPGPSSHSEARGYA